MACIIDRLEKAEIIRRASSALDRRAHLVWLTEKGSRLEQDLSRAAHRVQDRIKGQMTPGNIISLNGCSISCSCSAD